MIADFDNQHFQFKDTLKVYYKDDKLFVEGNYKKGFKQGKFNWYYKNGQVKTIGEYSAGQRSGTWEYFHPDGSSYKKIEYRGNKELLINLSDRKGKALVKDGNGTFNDEVMLSSSIGTLCKIKGEVINGYPNGKWHLTTAGTKIGTEYFMNTSFVKGVSHSTVFGDQEYYNEFLTTFSGINLIEQLKLTGPTVCGRKTDLGLTEDFFNQIKQRYNDSDIRNSLADGWFLIEIQSDEKNNIVKVEVFSNSGKEAINKIKNLIFNMNQVDRIRIKVGNSKAEYEYFPLVLAKGNIYLPHDDEVELLKHRY
jgi:hypothetical protein